MKNFFVVFEPNGRRHNQQLAVSSQESLPAAAGPAGRSASWMVATEVGSRPTVSMAPPPASIVFSQSRLRDEVLELGFKCAPVWSFLLAERIQWSLMNAPPDPLTSGETTTSPRCLCLSLSVSFSLQGHAMSVIEPYPHPSM